MNARELLTKIKNESSDNILSGGHSNIIQKLCENIAASQRQSYKSGTIRRKMVPSKEKIFFS